MQQPTTPQELVSNDSSDEFSWRGTHFGTSLLRSCVHVFEALGVNLEGNGHSENGT